MVKTVLGLSWPAPLQRGIRQGCPISGQLYSLAIESLLCRLRKRLSGLLLSGLSEVNHCRSVSAFADDIRLFVISKADVQRLALDLVSYEGASSAQGNCVKSKALLLWGWRVHTASSLLQSSKEELKVLGLFLGAEWEGN